MRILRCVRRDHPAEVRGGDRRRERVCYITSRCNIPRGASECPQGENRLDGAAREARWSELLQAASAGDEAAYRLLLADIAIRIRSVVRRRLPRGGGLESEVEDIVQETLLALHLKRHTWIVGQPVGPWVAAIARHKAIDAWRRAGRRAVLPLEEHELLDGELPEQADAPEATDAHDVGTLLARLGERDRAIVQAVSLEGLSTREASARLSMSEGALRVALHRSLKRLAALYRGEGRLADE